MSEQTIRVEFNNQAVILGLSQEEFDQIDAESEEFLQNLVQSRPVLCNALERGCETSLAWANKAFSAVWAASCQGHRSYAESLYLGCELNGRHWVDSEIPFPYPCPVCFDLSSCAHEVYRGNSDCLAEELPCGEQLQTLHERMEEWDLSAKKLTKINKIPEIAAIIKNAEDVKPWFLELECARWLRSFSVACDEDRWEDTLFVGYHPDPENFRAELKSCEAKITEILRSNGIDLDDT
jgi:hypothetical protein